MQILSEAEIIALIKSKQCFSASLDDGSLTFHISDYQPVVTTSIHSGSRMTASLAKKCNLSEQERFFEEDPFTGDFISSLPIVIQAEDSRYEYDLNRSADSCIYDDAWGKKVWRGEITVQERETILAKHARYYNILKALIETLEEIHSFCIVYDIHSYNFQRIDRETPLFNVGTQQIDGRRWRNAIPSLVSLLSDVEIPNTETSVGINDVFMGNGYQAKFIKQHCRSSLCIPLEIKKVYMNELTGEPYPLVIEQIKNQLTQVLVKHASSVIEKRAKMRGLSPADLLSQSLEKQVKTLDSQLFKLAKNLDTLRYINPVNLNQEKKLFFKKPFSYHPQFRYRQLDIDPYLFKEQLYRLPIEGIRDSTLQTLYRKVIDQLAKRIDLLTSIGTDEFLYNSLRYYGQPSVDDVENAKFLLHAKKSSNENALRLSADEVIKRFKNASAEYGIDCKIVATDKIVSGALVSGRTLKINPKHSIGEQELQALIDHELGVHIVTSANAETQPLKIFRIGLPGNTYTQEGLAILAEHLGGNLSVERLQTLALRVIAVDMMIKGHRFSDVYQELFGQYGLNSEKAFTITARVFRGGGFTKDYLYLSGLAKAIQLHQENKLHGLFIGKTSFEFMDTIDELISRDILVAPKYMPNVFINSHPRNDVVDYLVASIR